MLIEPVGQKGGIPCGGDDQENERDGRRGQLAVLDEANIDVHRVADEVGGKGERGLQGR